MRVCAGCCCVHPCSCRRACLVQYPNPADPLNGEAAGLLIREPERYEARVKGVSPCVSPRVPCHHDCLGGWSRVPWRLARFPCTFPLYLLLLWWLCCCCCRARGQVCRGPWAGSCTGRPCLPSPPSSGCHHCLSGWGSAITPLAGPCLLRIPVLCARRCRGCKLWRGRGQCRRVPEQHRCVTDRGG